MVGAGALGCEFLKMFALTGIACGPKGMVTVTDDDMIEKSNLNRQFLFRPEDIKHYKAVCAGKAAQIMNPALKLQVYQNRVGYESENVFHDEFWEKQDIVTNAVDNMKARLYIDDKCVYYQKPLFDSGTHGTKSSCMCTVPHLTN